MSNSSIKGDAKKLRLSKDITAPVVTGTVVKLIAGVAVSFGDTLYLKNDGKVWKASASAATTAPAIGIALTDTIVEDVEIDVLLNGTIESGLYSFTAGDKVYLGTAEGGVTAVIPDQSGEVVQILGVALGTTTMLFNPQLVTVTLI